MVIDDPYGIIRSNYNKQRYDDAYWSENDEGRLTGNRDERKNEFIEFDDWTISDTAQNNENERRGQESFITDLQVEKSINYIQLFHQEKKAVTNT